MLNTKTHHLSRFGVAANITVVAVFSLLTVFLISHRQDTVSNLEMARNSDIVQAVSQEEVLVSVKEAGGEITHGL
ncbi:MAG: hypothetical protein QNK19_02610 [Xanthomonadales bacterium]|nr:hypothetical protein [Xanthomonadales bacterium]